MPGTSLGGFSNLPPFSFLKLFPLQFPEHLPCTPAKSPSRKSMILPHAGGCSRDQASLSLPSQTRMSEDAVLPAPTPLPQTLLGDHCLQLPSGLSRLLGSVFTYKNKGLTASGGHVSRWLSLFTQMLPSYLLILIPFVPLEEILPSISHLSQLQGTQRSSQNTCSMRLK